MAVVAEWMPQKTPVIPICTMAELFEIVQLRRQVLDHDKALPSFPSEWRELMWLRQRAAAIETQQLQEQVRRLEALAEGLMTDPFVAGLRAAFAHASQMGRSERDLGKLIHKLDKLAKDPSCM